MMQNPIEPEAISTPAAAAAQPDVIREGELLQHTQSALLNILEDFVAEKDTLQQGQRSVMNILDDFEQEKLHLECSQRAVLNILEDSTAEKLNLEAAERAVLNILEDSFHEKIQLQDTGRAVLNILEDIKSVEAINQRVLEERKRADAISTELRAVNAELGRSNAELQDFAAIASHDLQEPLRKVIAFGDHLSEHCGENLDEQGRDFLARMQNAAQRMSVLIEALLQYSRVATRAQPVQSVDMLAVVFGVVADMEERIAKSHARIEFTPMPKVMADPMQMRQLIQNLVANALKFQRPGTSPHVVIEGRTTDHGGCEISVGDNGIGFEEKYLERIFRPFQRLHGRNEYEGSGMGLAICRKVVARHGGTITARSRPGEGSTFVATLPAGKITDGERRELWETGTAPSSYESCSPKTMTTIST
jgi:signal transduction histidine kinase